MWKVKEPVGGDYGIVKGVNGTESKVKIVLENERKQVLSKVVEKAWLDNRQLDIGSEWLDSDSTICNFGTVCERDIDVLLLNSFAVDERFVNLFTDKIHEKNLDRAKVVDIELSRSDSQLGESDVTVIIEKDGERYALLIEDKVGAKEQPEQCERYNRRGDKGRNENEYKDYYVFICASEEYIKTNEEAKKYKHSISFEELSDYFSSGNDTFSRVRYEHIQQALFSSKIPYKKVVDQRATDFWNQYVEYVRKIYPDLQLPNGSKLKSKSGDWPSFHTQLNLNNKVYIQHKTSKGIIDLTFNGMADRQAELAAFLKEKALEYDEKEMGIAKASKSGVLRIDLGCNYILDFQKPFKEQEEQVKKCLESIFKLHKVAASLRQADVKALLEQSNN